LKKFLSKINLVDALNYIYFFYLSIIILIRFKLVPYAGFLLFANLCYLLILTSLIIITRTDSPWFIRFLRFHLQIMAVTPIYRETEFFMRLYHNRWLDNIVVKIESFLFGKEFTLILDKLVSPLLTEILKLFYSTYFFIIPLVPLTLFLIKRYDVFYELVFTMTLALYLCYIGFTLFPVQGPRYYWAYQTIERWIPFPLTPAGEGPYYTHTLTGGIITKFVDSVMAFGDSTGACIPSAHNAASLALVGVIWRYFKKLRIPFTIIVIGIAVGTVYNRYHYFTDMITGLLVGFFSIWISRFFFKKKRDFIKD